MAGERHASSEKTKSATTKGMSDEQLYCVCRRPEIEGVLMIMCEKCDGWFHGPCVGVSRGQARNLSVYFCPQCVAAHGAPPNMARELAMPVSDDEESSVYDGDDDDDGGAPCRRS